MKAIRLKIYGRVQGVFFRKYTKEKAIEFSLQGCVCNCDDGTVEVNVEGEEQSLSQFIEWCHHGPSGAGVDKVDIHETELKNYKEFVILRA